MPKVYFDERIAQRYETYWPELFEPEAIEPAVNFLASLAGQEGRGSALELGVGTGRIALPLSQRGVRVRGIELSPAMVARLRAQPGADRIKVTVGDFATTQAGGTFDVAYLVRNTITNLTTQDEQVECIRNAADHLGPGGRLVVELWIPDLRRFPPGAVALPFEVGPSHLGFDEIDVATQRGVSHHYFVGTDRVGRFDSPYRYVWPAELDLMARIAGMRLRERWADWDRSPFTSESRKHISVWERPPDAYVSG